MQWQPSVSHRNRAGHVVTTFLTGIPRQIHHLLAVNAAIFWFDSAGIGVGGEHLIVVLGAQGRDGQEIYAEP